MLFGRFSAADAFFAPVVMRIRTCALPLSEVSQGYASRLEESVSVREWVAGTLAEQDFRPFEEPCRSAP